MSNLSKLTVLLFAVALSFVSISTDSYVKVTDIKHHGIGGDNSPSHSFSDFELSTFCLFRSVEHVSQSVNNFPTPNSKRSWNGSLGASFSIEVRLQTIALQYLLHSKKINRSLAIRDIIYPFHSFL